MNEAPNIFSSCVSKKAAVRALSFFVLTALLSGCRPGTKPQGPDTATLTTTQTEAGRPEPGRFYATAKPYTRWWWFASEIRKDDVARQLDWLKERGFGGVEIA